MKRYVSFLGLVLAMLILGVALADLTSLAPPSVRASNVVDDTEMIQGLLDEARANNKVLRLPKKRKYKISRTLINDAVPMDGGWDGDMTWLKWIGDEGGLMMEIKSTSTARLQPQMHIIRGLAFDGNLKASAIRITGRFTIDSTLSRCRFYRAIGPVISGKNCWDSTLEYLRFDHCVGNLLTIHHSSGVIHRIETRACEADASGTPPIVIRGSGGSATNICLDSGTHYPGLPLIRFEGCWAKMLSAVRTEGGVNGVIADGVVELVGCEGCVVSGVNGIFQYDSPGRYVVRAVGGGGNPLIGVSGGTILQPDGCVVEFTAGSIVPVAVHNKIKPGKPGYCPTFREILAE